MAFSVRYSAWMLTLGVFSIAAGSLGCERTRDQRETVPATTAQSVSHLAPTPASPAASASAGASASASAPPPAGAQLRADYNVLVLSIDSLRADMPWNGYARPIAPRLTELEKRSISYTHAYAISSYTSMSLGGFLGGKLPSEMKRSGFFFGKYAPENVLFPEVLQAAGVRTIAAHAHGYFKDAGFEQGFDKYEIVPNIVFKNETDPNVTSPQHEALAEKLLGDPELDSKRFFAWFHFLDPHDMYVAHDKDGIPPYGPKLRDKYDAEVTFTDRYIGKLLDFVESRAWGKRTVVIVTADHGEAFGEHDQFAHGFELWEHLVRVPMFFVIPGLNPKRIDVARSTIDLAPTILELLGVSATTAAGAGTLDLEGKSLVPELSGKVPPAERDVVLDLPMTSDNDKRRAIVHGASKIVAYGKSESLRLYDLAADPEEKHPITRGETFDEMARRYRDLSRGVKEVAPYACGPNCLNRAYAKPGGGK
ncbi:MAG TPA: sulfatase [Labilithrix sp.]|nr:sulfatase [Labilithrix sp.]